MLGKLKKQGTGFSISMRFGFGDEKKDTSSTDSQKEKESKKSTETSHLGFIIFIKYFKIINNIIVMNNIFIGAVKEAGTVPTSK